MNPRHARICPRAGAQVYQHQPLVHAMSRNLKGLGIRHQVESGEPFTTDRNLRINNGARRGFLQDAPNRESCWVSPMLTLKSRYTCEEAVLIAMDQLPPPPRRASVNNTLVRDMCPLTNGVTYLPL